MSKFFEVYKLLVSYEMFHKEGSPHLSVISMNPDTQHNPGAVEFDYKSVWDREDKYKDVAGFYHTHPSGMNQMSQIDINTMVQWVKCLGKSLICIIETDEKVNGWLFTKSDTGKINFQEIGVSTNNDVNYDVWLDPQESFFNPVDFLTEGEFFSENDEAGIFEGIQERLTNIEETQSDLRDRFNKLIELLKPLVENLPRKPEK